MSVRALCTQSCFESILTHKNLQDHWILDTYVVNYINQVHNLQCEELKITKFDLNKTIGENPLYKLHHIKDSTKGNKLGIYYNDKFHRSPSDQSLKRVRVYYFCSKPYRKPKHILGSTRLNTLVELGSDVILKPTRQNNQNLKSYATVSTRSLLLQKIREKSLVQPTMTQVFQKKSSLKSNPDVNSKTTTPTTPIDTSSATARSSSNAVTPSPEKITVPKVKKIRLDDSIFCDVIDGVHPDGSLDCDDGDALHSQSTSDEVIHSSSTGNIAVAGSANDNCDNHNNDCSIPSNSKNTEEVQSPKRKKSDLIRSQDYWQSPEARKLFGLKSESESDQSPVDLTIRARIHKLTHGFVSPNGWKTLLNGVDPYTKFTQYEISCVQRRARYLAMALQVALHESQVMTWKACCEEALGLVNDFDNIINVVDDIKSGNTEDDGNQKYQELPSDQKRINNPSPKKTVSQCLTIHSPETIMEWNRQFRNNNESFPSPKFFRSGKTMLPTLLDRYPKLKEDLLKFMVNNLSELSIELVHEYLHDTAFPKLVEKRKEETKFVDFTVDHLLKENGLSKLSLSTTWRWMKLLGMKYSERRKNYYVDGHESEENVSYRGEFIFRYMGYDRRSARYIQIGIEQMLHLEEIKELTRDMGFAYETADGDIMFEFHVDQHPTFHEEMNIKHKFGGKLSVRKKLTDKQIIIFGQDESIFRQYIFTNKSWKKPDGGFILVPKDEGQGLMLSSFTSREFGFGFELSPRQLRIINNFRKGKQYSDKDAAKNRLGTSFKSPLKSSPFSISFEYGANAQGYWNYDAMALQFEDCVDCLLALFGDMYHFVFLFDHSSGHDKKRPDGLNISKMIKNYGGSQPVMRSSMIQDDSFLGPFHDPSNPVMVKVGEEQSMVFSENDEGPFYMGNAKRTLLRSDHKTGTTRQRDLTSTELLERLKDKYSMSYQGSSKQIRDICVTLDMPLKITEERIELSWIGKPKGKFQILYERGFIDTSSIRSYTLKGPMENGLLKEDFSIDKLMEKQVDFQEEETLLQYHGRLMGVTVDRSPKCHPEIAGEGIEYAWGAAKCYYRRLPMEKKRKKSVFQKSVADAVDCSKVLTVERCRLFSKRAREYMLAYDAMSKCNKIAEDIKKEIEEKGGIENCELSEDKKQIMIHSGKHDIKGEVVDIHHCLIEKVLKHYKSHRSMIDQDKGFITSVVKMMKSEKSAVIDEKESIVKDANVDANADATNSDVDDNDNAANSDALANDDETNSDVVDDDDDTDLDDSDHHKFPSDLPPLIRDPPLDKAKKLCPPQRTNKMYEESSSSGSEADSVHSKGSKISWTKVIVMDLEEEQHISQLKTTGIDHNDEEKSVKETQDDDIGFIFVDEESAKEAEVEDVPHELFIQDAFVLSSQEDSSSDDSDISGTEL